MKKEIIKSIQILSLALMIGASTALVFGDWSEPAGLPTSNAPAPVNESRSIQTKGGTFNVISDLGTAKATANILSIFGTSYLAGDVKVGDADAPFLTPDINLNVTGKVGINLDEGETVTLSPTEAIDINGTARFSELSQGENPDVDFPAPVCITESGTLFLCPGPGELVAGISVTPTITNQDVVLLYENPGGIDGPGWDHNCSADVSFSSSVAGGALPLAYSWKVKNNSGAPLVLINNIDASDNMYDTVGSSSFVSFSVDEKNPHLLNRDDWTIELSVTGGDGEVDTTTQDFEVWNIEECAD